MDTDAAALMATIKVNGAQAKEPCIVVQQFFYTYDPDKNFFISETIGELCGDGVQFREEGLRLISASGTVPLTVCTPNADGSDVVLTFNRRADQRQVSSSSNLRRSAISPTSRSCSRRATSSRSAAAHKITRPYRPQTNGKAERFNRTLLDEWAYAKLYRSNGARLAALPTWLQTYNHPRPHTALGGLPPISRVSTT